MLNNYDADAIKEDTDTETPIYVTDRNGSRFKLNGTEVSSPLLAGNSPQKTDSEVFNSDLTQSEITAQKNQNLEI